jgi:hypothetical protein
MEKTISMLKDFFTSSKMITVYWQGLNGTILALIGTLALIQPEQVDIKIFPLIGFGIALLNRITKEINKKYL